MKSTIAETILVVDDHEAVRELIEVILGRAGYQVLTASNGPDALRIARDTRQIDLLVSDIEMPLMRGDELAVHFARLHPAAPVLFLSSSERPGGTTIPFQFLTKPFGVGALRDSVHRLLRACDRVEETPCAA